MLVEEENLVSAETETVHFDSEDGNLKDMFHEITSCCLDFFEWNVIIETVVGCGKSFFPACSIYGKRVETGARFWNVPEKDTYGVSIPAGRNQVTACGAALIEPG